MISVPQKRHIFVLQTPHFGFFEFEGLQPSEKRHQSCCSELEVKCLLIGVRA